jgi:phosphatidylglycerophosphate synthase
MIPNIITLSRLPLLVGVVLLLYQPAPDMHVLAAGLIILLILLDSLDGIVARSLNQASLLGSLLDIAADRAVELVLWIAFADLDLIPVIIPLLVVVRGVFVDALRAIAPSKGLAPFDLMRSSLGKFLVKSPWLRMPYGVAKASAFFLLALQRGAAMRGAASAPAVAIAAQAATWIALGFCVVRGLPVLIEAPRALVEV